MLSRLVGGGFCLHVDMDAEDRLPQKQIVRKQHHVGTESKFQEEAFLSPQRIQQSVCWAKKVV